MPRRHQFALTHIPSTELSGVSGPIPFLNPTRAQITSTKPIAPTQTPPASTPTLTHEPTHRHHISLRNQGIEHLWRSRDNRKGRHAIRVPAQAPEEAPLLILPSATSSPRSTARGVLRMLTVFPYWDISYWVAVVFTWGSIIWVLNAFFVWLPLAAPSTEFPNEVLVGGGVTAFIGATVFEIGSVLLLLEAVNENSTACFGWAVETELKRIESRHGHARDQATVTVQPSVEKCSHHHGNHRSFLAQPLITEEEVEEGSGGGSQSERDRKERRTFKWLPSLTELRTHYIHELGFQASAIQMIGASIFWIAGFTGLPGIIDHLSQRVENGVYWVPQMVGGTCFIISGFLFALETQKKWYIPAVHTLGWHIGMWNFIGGIGFTLCGALGPGTGHSGMEYQATLATFWGSWAFLIGSGIQWYESLQKYPVEVE